MRSERVGVDVRDTRLRGFFSWSGEGIRCSKEWTESSTSLWKLSFCRLLGAEPQQANGFREVGQQVPSGVNQREQQKVASTNPDDPEEEPGY